MNPEADKSFEDKREKYPKYFEGLQTLSDYQKKLDDALEELKNTNEELGNVKNKAGKFFAYINGRGSDMKIADPLPLKKYRLKNRLCEFSLTHSKDKRNNDSGM